MLREAVAGQDYPEPSPIQIQPPYSYYLSVSFKHENVDIFLSLFLPFWDSPIQIHPPYSYYLYPFQTFECSYIDMYSIFLSFFLFVIILSKYISSLFPSNCKISIFVQPSFFFWPSRSNTVPIFTLFPSFIFYSHRSVHHVSPNVHEMSKKNCKIIFIASSLLSEKPTRSETADRLLFYNLTMEIGKYKSSRLTWH